MHQHNARTAPGASRSRSFRPTPTAGTACRAIAVGVAASALVLTAVQSAPAADAVAGGSHEVVSTVHSDNGRYVLRLAPGTSHAAVTGAVEKLGGSVVAFQNRLDTVVVKAPDDAVPGLGSVPGVVGVAPDGRVRAQSLGFDPNSQPGSMTKVTEITGAKEYWKRGYTGQGVDIAIIDTGVAPVSGLKDPAKVVVGPDLSFESQDTDTQYLDSYGHGTNMAGIIAGRETSKSSGQNYANDNSNFYGMAPDARLISLKLADHGGAVDVSQMIAAIDWVVWKQYSDGMNIKILNLSYGSLSQQDAQADPLSWAAEVAWRNNILVVASTGNDGDSVVGLASPAYNPWILAVGAQDTKGTTTYADDTVPSFSERGVSGGRGPDLVAPGVGIVSLGVPGSKLYAENSAARIGNGFMRGSGTSQAAAVVSGAAALMMSKQAMMPNAVKNVLKASATKLSGVDAAAQGAGALNLRQALVTPEPGGGANPPMGHGRGTLEKARGSNKVVLDGAAISGEIDIMGQAWNSSDMAQRALNHQAWGGDGYFNYGQWTGGGFSTNTSSWAGKTWQGKTWQGKTWQSNAWAGKTWQGKTWQTGVWNGSGWSSSSWGGPISVPNWAGRTWSSAGWK